MDAISPRVKCVLRVVGSSPRVLGTGCETENQHVSDDLRKAPTTRRGRNDSSLGAQHLAFMEPIKGLGVVTRMATVLEISCASSYVVHFSHVARASKEGPTNMPADVTFDTITAVQRLRDAGIELAHAEAITASIHAGVTGGVATKADVELSKIKLERQIEKAKFDLTWRLIAAIGVINAVFLALSRYLPPAG